MASRRLANRVDLRHDLFRREIGGAENAEAAGFADGDDEVHRRSAAHRRKDDGNIEPGEWVVAAHGFHFVAQRHDVRFPAAALRPVHRAGCGAASPASSSRSK